MTLDEETIKLYEEMKVAARDGNLLMYANRLAVRIGSVETRSNPETPRSPIPQPMREQMVREAVRSVSQRYNEIIGLGDNVRVANL